MNPDHGLGPPESDVPALLEEPAPTTTPTVDTPDSNRSAGKRTFTRPTTPKPLPRICPTDIPGQLRARRQAAHRSVPLDCGCRDPWPCRCTEPPLSDRMIDAGRAAALHVLDTGKVPLLELEVLRALYRRGGSDRQLAEQLHEACGGVIA